MQMQYTDKLEFWTLLTWIYDTCKEMADSAEAHYPER